MRKIFWLIILTHIGFLAKAQWLPIGAGSANPLTGDLFIGTSSTNSYKASFSTGAPQLYLFGTTPSDTFGNAPLIGFFDNTHVNDWGLQVDASYNFGFWKYSGGWNKVAGITQTGGAFFGDKVGIGTASPIQTLDVTGDIAARGTAGTQIQVLGNGSDTFAQGSNLYLGNVNTTGAATIQLNSSQGLDFWNYSLSTGTWQQHMTITNTGSVGIGTTSPDEKLTVNGAIHSTEVKVTATVPAPDYVFKADYKLPKLSELQAYIHTNHHLPEIPSATEMETNGISLGEMNTKLLKKVEELTLYLIEQKVQHEKEVKKLNRQLQRQQKQINQIEGNIKRKSK